MIRANSLANNSYFSVPVEKINQRGRLFEFLVEIGKPLNFWYRRLDSLFVNPNEYAEIVDSLEKNKVVFIVGDPEIGKTYLALRIMWEYFSRGYTPHWNVGAEKKERADARRKMCDCEVSDHSITYFEDPFGKTQFEDREELRRTIGSFISRIQNLDSRVILTSREEIFRRFEKEKLSQHDLKMITVEMRLMKPSYDRQKMSEILKKWAEEFECKWLDSEPLRSTIMKKAVEEIPTPLGLRDFALDSRKDVGIAWLEQLIKEKSKEVKEVFAEEIAAMDKEKIVFLSLLHILPSSAPPEIKAKYEEVCNRLDLDLESNSFELLRYQFSPKVSSRHIDQGGFEFFEFSHPSYQEGLVLSWNRPHVRSIFLRMVQMLIKDEKPSVRGHVALCLVENFQNLTFKDEARSLIEPVFRDRNAVARFGAVFGLERNFENLPNALALLWLEISCRDPNREIRGSALEFVGQIFKKLPSDLSLRLLSEGIRDRAAYARMLAAKSIGFNMACLPQDIITDAKARLKELRNYGGWSVRKSAEIYESIFEDQLGKQGRAP